MTGGDSCEKETCCRMFVSMEETRVTQKQSACIVFERCMVMDDELCLCCTKLCVRLLEC